jgi:hypothetical protein
MAYTSSQVVQAVPVPAAYSITAVVLTSTSSVCYLGF